MNYFYAAMQHPALANIHLTTQCLTRDANDLTHPSSFTLRWSDLALVLPERCPAPPPNAYAVERYTTSPF
jgi:hypothetical protein